MSTTTTAEKPATTPFERLGGHATLQQITNRFYDLMDSDPAYAELRAMHAPDLTPMRTSLASFLAGWSGGPRDWFEANPGRCMMSLHKDFAIDRGTARQWTDAMTRAIDETVAASDAEIAKALAGVLERMAMGMAR
ncbi:MAG: group II truncated hemoglobin [Pseudomonadota bacterium]